MMSPYMPQLPRVSQHNRHHYFVGSITQGGQGKYSLCNCHQHFCCGFCDKLCFCKYVWITWSCIGKLLNGKVLITSSCHLTPCRFEATVDILSFSFWQACLAAWSQLKNIFDHSNSDKSAILFGVYLCLIFFTIMVFSLGWIQANQKIFDKSKIFTR